MFKGKRDVGTISVKEVLGIGSTMKLDESDATAW